MGRLSLAEALDLCLLYRSERDRYERAAARWIARLIAERPGVRLSEIELAAAAFREAPQRPTRRSGPPRSARGGPVRGVNGNLTRGSSIKGHRSYDVNHMLRSLISRRSTAASLSGVV